VQELLNIRDVIDAKTLDHLLNTLGAERVLGIDVDHAAVKAALLFGQLDVDCHLVDDLAFTGTKLTVHLGDRLCFKAATEECVELRDPERELPDVLSLLEDVFSGLETADICGFAGRLDDLLRRGL